MQTLTTAELQSVSDLLRADGIRELAHRENDGVSVWLLWDESNDEILVALTDRKMGTDTAFGVERDCANDAFAHPFTYLPTS